MNTFLSLSHFIFAVLYKKREKLRRGWTQVKWGVERKERKFLFVRKSLIFEEILSLYLTPPPTKNEKFFVFFRFTRILLMKGNRIFPGSCSNADCCKWKENFDREKRRRQQHFEREKHKFFLVKQFAVTFLWMAQKKIIKKVSF